MSQPPIFAANWKMHLGPAGAGVFLDVFLANFEARTDREVWLFPSAVALTGVVKRVRDTSITVGVQNVHWEPKGAYTGELSISMAAEAGARSALVGHSERRHVFNESDEETGQKVRALIEHKLTPMLCVGEKLDEREAGKTMAVVERQLRVLEGIPVVDLNNVLIAYEPVWAIGTGKTATPADASEVHAGIRSWCARTGMAPDGLRILYGGSVKPSNVESLLAEPEIDGVLVGGASLDPTSWRDIVTAPVD